MRIVPRFVRLVAVSASLGGIAFAQSPGPLSEPLSEARAVESFNQFLEQRTAQDQFSGAALVAKGDRILFSAAYGLSNREEGTPNTLETRFRLGSMNKMFTAVSVLQLVQAGRVALDGSLGTYVADYPNREVAEKTTIHHLLTHTGGTGNFFGPEYDAEKKNLRTLDDYLGLHGARGLAFEPGERWEYSNYGFILLGLVIERVTGQSYYDYVQEHVYEAAGMTSSASDTEDETERDHSVGYMMSEEDDRLVPNTDWLAYRGTSAGGGYSTVGDLLRFTQALLSSVLLDAEHTQLLLAPQVDTEWGRFTYGLFDLRGDDHAGWIGHGGSAPGMNAELRIYPRSGYVSIVLANLSRPAAIEPINYFETRLLAR